MSERNEPDQIARASAGDRRAQAWLVNRHMPGVYALARRMMGSDTEAEDVTQETFLRAWKALPAWQPRARLSTWLYRVALNMCYDRLRKRRETSLDGLDEPVDPEPRPEQALSRAQDRAALEAAIDRLPTRQKAALTLCALQGHTNIEAAEILEVSVEAVESLLARARRRLRATLDLGRNPDDAG